MSQTSAYKIRLKTDSADSSAILLFEGGALVAVLVQLADESHGDDRGQWTIEATFGLNAHRRPNLFVSAKAAADWVSLHICREEFIVNEMMAEIG